MNEKIFSVKERLKSKKLFEGGYYDCIKYAKEVASTSCKNFSVYSKKKQVAQVIPSSNGITVVELFGDLNYIGVLKGILSEIIKSQQVKVDSLRIYERDKKNYIVVGTKSFNGSCGYEIQVENSENDGLVKAYTRLVEFFSHSKTPIKMLYVDLKGCSLNEAVLTAFPSNEKGSLCLILGKF